VNIDEHDASELIAEVDERDHEDRAARLVELTGLLPEEGAIGFSGQAAKWLFDDVKATLLYGCFASTVVTAHAFCSLQLAGLMRLLADDPGLPDEAGSLEQLAAMAISAEAIDVDLQASLIELHERHRDYTAAHLHEHEGRLERHLGEASAAMPGHPLLLDARAALTTAIRLLFGQP
jgi:hypothetical protein